MENIDNGELNFGKLRGKVEFGGNITYRRRGLEDFSLNITNACPNSCTFCIRNTDPGWGVSNLYMIKDPSLVEIKASIDAEILRNREAKVQLKRIKICGYGEPLMRFGDLIPICEHIQTTEANSRIQLTTTGWPFFKYVGEDTSKMNLLKSAGLTDVYLSICTLDKSKYDRIVRPGIDNLEKYAFADAMRFGIAARDLGLEVTLGFINLPETKKEELRGFAEKMRFRYALRELE